MHFMKFLNSNRKTLLINPPFQLQILAYACGLAFAIIAIFYGATLYFFRNFKQLGEDIVLPLDHVFFQFLAEQKNTMDIIFIITAVLAFVVISICGLIISHRVAGPLHRLKQHMGEVAGGQTVSDVKFRKKDFFPELADAFNLQLKYLRERMEKRE